jgi:hypothetical protein
MIAPPQRLRTPDMKPELLFQGVDGGNDTGAVAW